MVHAEAYLLVNAALCACSLPLGGKLAGLPAPKGARLLLSALLGSAFSMLSLLVPWLSLLALAGLPFSVWLCFGRHGPQACVRCSVTTLCASLLTGGAALSLLSAGLRIAPALLLSALLSMLLYMLATLLPTALCEVRQVELRMEDRRVILPAMLDSGNLLSDPVTGLPVLVVPEKALKTLFPGVEDLCDLKGLPLGFRLLNVRTAAGGALLPMFRPDECRLYLNGHACDTELLVAVAGREYGGVQALVPMAALPQKMLAQS